MNSDAEVCYVLAGKSYSTELEAVLSIFFDASVSNSKAIGNVPRMAWDFLSSQLQSESNIGVPKINKKENGRCRNILGRNNANANRDRAMGAQNTSRKTIRSDSIHAAMVGSLVLEYISEYAGDALIFVPGRPRYRVKDSGFERNRSMDPENII
ncbi:hypothetical protein C8R44DRAFT_724531 [Mycena epipterygia]|nr:hypothetical protein C8R44DRAFT_724531 [Mycena epipterygia]